MGRPRTSLLVDLAIYGMTLAARSSPLRAWMISVMRMTLVSTQLACTRVRVKEQSSRKISQEFRQEASEQLAKHSDDVAKGVKDATRQDLTDQFVESSFNGNLIKEYVKDVKLNTNRNIPNNQIEELKNTLRLREYEKLSPVELAKHRAEFNRLKNSLINEWELKTGLTWPTYS